MNGELETTVLWQAFVSKSDDEARAHVRRLVDHATAILDRIVETFPTYTLHNHVHALNVVRLMGDLLGPALSELTGLESALLILAAYYHDVGMYYRKDELETLIEEEWFEEFLQTYSEAYIDFTSNGRMLTEGLAEWYCRWRHADRVYHFINLLSDEELCWGVIPLREKLGEVCRSHNREVAFLKDDDIFEINYLQRCDVRFCAILLRLADILDFDRTRSPEFVYTYLGLSRGDSLQLKRSNEEWRKHVAAEGFTFPIDLSAPYPLPFIAAPDEPTVEHDIRAFLDTIDEELKECAALLRSCSPRWRDFALPIATFRDIRPRGYRYGAYRFDLDRHQILSLFMGENLYSSPYVFLRELLQNAIDTSRHRLFFEHGRGNTKFQPAPIEVSEWLDEESYRWVRIDDCGMGMDEYLILDYFLSVGRSYYSSADFRAELLRYTTQEGKAFMPISRFGIGVLSCFIVGDCVEVSSRKARLGETPYKPVRLSLRGLESFYVLQTEPMPPRLMPSSLGGEKAYRAQVGTSIAVRFDPSKDRGDFDLPSLLRRFILASPIPVNFHGEALAAASEDLVSTPWFEGQRSKNLSIASRRTTSSRSTSKQTNYEAGVVAIPLDLTSVSPDPRFRGQMALLGMSPKAQANQNANDDDSDQNANDDELPEGRSLPYYMSSTVRGGRWELSENDDDIDPNVVVDLDELFGNEIGRRAASVLHSALVWSHNGVALPELIQVKIEDSGSSIEANLPVDMTFEMASSFDQSREYVQRQFVGCWSFSDDLRIDVSASRDVVRALPWHILSLVQFTVNRACAAANHPLAEQQIWPSPVPLDSEYFGSVPQLGVMIEDSILTAQDGWMSLSVLELKNPVAEENHKFPQDALAPLGIRTSFYSVNEVRDGIADGKAVRPILPSFTDIAQNRPGVEFGTALAAALVRISLNVAWALNEPTQEWEYIVTDAMPIPICEGELALPPLYVVPYVGHYGLRAGQGPLNRNHPFAEWFIDAIVPLREHYPSVFALMLKDLGAPYVRFPNLVAERVLRINGALDRLRGLGFSPLPPARISLTLVDFV